MGNYIIGLIMIIGSIIIYLVARKINNKFPIPITLPILISTIIGGSLLMVLDIPYETYMLGGQWIEWLLGPAVVSLAYPLYKQWEILKSNPLPIILGVTIGGCVGVTLVILFIKWAGFENSIIFSAIPKNSTTPVAMEVAESLGGIPAMAVVFVMIAGIGGALLGPTLMKLCRINHFIGKGVGMGTASHAIGTAEAMENSEEEGAVSTVAMTIGAVTISIISPILVYILL